MCWQFSFIVLCKPTFSYLASCIVCTVLVPLRTLSDSWHLFTYAFRNDFSENGRIFLYMGFHSWLFRFTMGAIHPWYGSSPHYMVFIESFWYIPRLLCRSLSIIISYRPEVDLSTWNFHITIFIALRLGKYNYTFTIKLERRTSWGSRRKYFWQQQGCHGDRNSAGVTRARESWRGGSTDSE